LILSGYRSPPLSLFPCSQVPAFVPFFSGVGVLWMARRLLGLPRCVVYWFLTDLGIICRVYWWFWTGEKGAVPYHGSNRPVIHVLLFPDSLYCLSVLRCTM
jgi:hypothetical protein